MMKSQISSLKAEVQVDWSSAGNKIKAKSQSHAEREREMGYYNNESHLPSSARPNHAVISPHATTSFAASIYLLKRYKPIYTRAAAHLLTVRAVVSDLVQRTSNISPRGQLTLADHTGRGCVSALYFCVCLCVSVGLHPCLFLINGVWRDYADSVCNWDTGTQSLLRWVWAYVRVCPWLDVSLRGRFSFAPRQVSGDAVKTFRFLLSSVPKANMAESSR